MIYFTSAEFTCMCGCGKNNVSDKLMLMLDTARESAGVPFIVTSGCRCKAHNQRVGGKPSSAHLDGLAADISTPTSRDRYKILKALLGAGFSRIGIGASFIHVDIAKEPCMVAWTY